MKKKLAGLFSSILLAALLVATLCACSTYGSVKKAFEDKGYVETEVADEYVAAAKKLLGDDYENVSTLHVLKKETDESDGVIGAIAGKIGYVAIVEFNSTDDLNEKMKGEVSEEDAKAAAEKIQELDIVSGNCVLVMTTLPEGATIFKSTK